MKKIVYGLISLIILYILWNQWQCPIKALTGIPCLGCGMTRALKSAIVGDFKAAFRFHPLFFMVPVIGVGIIKQKAFSKQQKISIGIVIAISFIVVYAVRVFYLKDNLLSIEWQTSWLYKQLKKASFIIK